MSPVAVDARSRQTLKLVRTCPDCGRHGEHPVTIISNLAKCTKCGAVWGVRVKRSECAK